MNKWISKIRISNYLGIKELDLSPEKINILKGKTGSGKSSLLDAIEKAYSNKDRRPESITTGETEAMILIEQTDGLTIDRKKRPLKSDSLTLKQDGKKIKSTETQIRKLLNGDIFRPLEWAKRSTKEQTDSILKMIEINFTEDDIEGWFGEKPQDGSIIYNQHILQLLKDIENYYFNIRTGKSREIRFNNDSIIKIRASLPDNYDGNDWKDVDLDSFYTKLNDARKNNLKINNAADFIDSIQQKIDSVTLKINSEKEKVDGKYSIKLDAKKKFKDAMQLDAKNIDEELDNRDNVLNLQLSEAEKNYKTILEKAKNEFESIQVNLKNKAIEDKNIWQKDLVGLREKISSVDLEIQEINNNIETANEVLEEREKLEKKELVKKLETQKELVKNPLCDVETINNELNEVKTMQTFVREWEREQRTKDSIVDYEKEVEDLTKQLEIARELPFKLLKQADIGIKNISLSSEGELLVFERPIGNMSKGEMNNFSLDVAREQAGDLKLICLDGFHDLDTEMQNKLMITMKTDDFQYFLTVTDTGEFRIEHKLGDGE